ncbi:MAG: DUF4349 domain-containing protein [Planctomycetes bacterium]|nr:DUF4349 domain-containing protein [Planctomycetota bacterium]
MDCNEARLLIDERVQGVPASDAHARLDEHLHACPDCTQDLAQLMKTRELLAEARNDMPPEGELARIWTRIQQQQNEKLDQGRAPLPAGRIPSRHSTKEDDTMEATVESTRVHRPPLRLQDEKRPTSKWKLVALSSLLAAALLLVCFQVGKGAYGERSRMASATNLERPPRNADGGFSYSGPVIGTEDKRSGKDEARKQAEGQYGWAALNEEKEREKAQAGPTNGPSSNIVVPAEVLSKAELTDHFETVPSEKPATPGTGGGFAGPDAPTSGGRLDSNGDASDLKNTKQLESPKAPSVAAIEEAEKDLGKDTEKTKETERKVLAVRHGGGKADPKANEPKAEGETAIDRPKIIKSGEITVEVKNFVDASRQTDALVVKYQGFVADSHTFDLPGGTRSGTIVIRVAPEKFEELFAELKKIGSVLTERAGGQDITAAYVDTEARIKNLQISEARLQDLIKSKNWLDKMADLLQVEHELARVRGEIEGYQGQMRVWQNQISLSTIRLTIQEPTRAVPSGSLAVEIASLTEAKKTLDAALATAGGQLLSGQITKREDGTLMGTYTLKVNFGRFGDVVGAIKGLGRTEDERIVNQPFGGAVPVGAESVPCELGLRLFERSVSLPRGDLRLEVVSMGDAMSKLNMALSAAQGSILSNQTQRQGDGSTASTISLRVKAGNFQGLMDALPAMGRVAHRVVNGEAAQVQGGAAEVPCAIQLYLYEPVKQVPTGALSMEVAKFTEGRDKLSALIKDKEIQILASTSARRPDGTWTGTFKLGVKAPKMDETVSEIEKLGRVKTRQGQGLGLGDLAKVDASVIGEVTVLLEEKPQQIPTAQLGLEVEKFDETRDKLSALIKDKDLQILDRNLQKRDGVSFGTFKLGIKADKMDEAVAEIEKLGRVKTRVGQGLGLSDPSKADSNVIGEVTVLLEEKPTLAPQEEGAFRLMLRDTFGGFFASMGYIIRGLGFIGPWLMIFGLFAWLVVRSQRKKEAETAAQRAALQRAVAPAPKTPDAPSAAESKPEKKE